MRRWWLWGLVAAVLGVAVGVPAFVLADDRASSERSDRDQRLQRLALETVFALPQDASGELDVAAYVQSPRPANGDLTALLDRDGSILGGDVVPPLAVRRFAAARARRGEESAVTSRGLRLVAVSVESEDEPLGVVMAFAPASRDDGSDERRDVLLLALAGWALLVVLSVVALSRALRPVDAGAATTGAFLADAAHELRTPWAIVRGRAEKALGASDPSADLKVIADTAAAAGSTITDMLDVARLDAGRAVSERVSLRLDALVSACCDERRPVAALASVELRVSADEAVVVSGDEALLLRAVGNLIDNAIRHGGAGGSVDVSVSRSGSSAEVVVSDRGPGIPPGQRERIFDRFHRGSAAAAGGSGLGLPIARMVAEAHGGTLAVRDTRDGATFALTLPCTKSPGQL